MKRNKNIAKKYALNNPKPNRRSSIKFVVRYCRLSLILITTLVLFGLNYFGQTKVFMHDIYSNYNSLCRKWGLKLENVYLEGQNHVTNKQILEATNIRIGQSMFAFSLAQIKQNLEKIGWIKYAIVERQLPNILYIGIIEKTPLALWQNDKKIYLIDTEGSVITDQNLGSFADLILVIGEDAPLYANNLISTINKDKELFKEVSIATRVGERRWNIRFHNDIEIKLPEENFVKAWDYVIKLYRQKNLFGQNIKIIDLRIPKKLFIQ